MNLPAAAMPTKETPSNSSLKDYSVNDLIGKGGFGRVYNIVHRKDGSRYALKMISKSMMEDKGVVGRVINEIEIHLRLNHSSIVHLHDFFEDSGHIYLIMELCGKGNLYKRLRAVGTFSEISARVLFSQLVEGVAYLHSHGIVHRDLKLSNLLLTDDETVKIADFGLATKLDSKSNEEQHTVCGTPNYVAPEVIASAQIGNNGYGVQADIWSLGCLLYLLLTGTTPFPKPSFDLEDEKHGADKKTETYALTFPDYVSNVAQDLIKSLLRVDPHERPRAVAIMAHPFFASIVDKQNNRWNGIMTEELPVTRSNHVNQTNQAIKLNQAYGTQAHLANQIEQDYPANHKNRITQGKQSEQINTTKQESQTRETNINNQATQGNVNIHTKHTNDYKHTDLHQAKLSTNNELDIEPAISRANEITPSVLHTTATNTASSKPTGNGFLSNRSNGSISISTGKPHVPPSLLPRIEPGEFRALRDDFGGLVIHVLRNGDILSSSERVGVRMRFPLHTDSIVVTLLRCTHNMNNSNNNTTSNNTTTTNNNNTNNKSTGSIERACPQCTRIYTRTDMPDRFKHFYMQTYKCITAMRGSAPRVVLELPEGKCQLRGNADAQEVYIEWDESQKRATYRIAKGVVSLTDEWGQAEYAVESNSFAWTSGQFSLERQRAALGIVDAAQTIACDCLRVAKDYEMTKWQGKSEISLPVVLRKSQRESQRSGIDSCLSEEEKLVRGERKGMPKHVHHALRDVTDNTASERNVNVDNCAIRIEQDERRRTEPEKLSVSDPYMGASNGDKYIAQDGGIMGPRETVDVRVKTVSAAAADIIVYDNDEDTCDEEMRLSGGKWWMWVGTEDVGNETGGQEVEAMVREPGTGEAQLRFDGAIAMRLHDDTRVMISSGGRYTFERRTHEQPHNSGLVVVEAGDRIPAELLASFKAARLLVSCLRQVC